MTAFAGLRGTGDFGDSDERPRSFREMILRLNPNGSAPVFALSSMMNTESVSDPEHSWFEEKNRVVRVQVTSALSTSSTAVTLTAVTGQDPTGLDLKDGDLLMVESTEGSTYNQEIVVVSSVQSSTQITIQRAACGTSAAGISAGTYLSRIGSWYGEGTGAPPISLRNPEKLKNYTQIFKDPYGDSETAKATTWRTGNPLKNDRIRKMFDHSQSLEYAMIFGKPHEDLTGGGNGKPRRSMGGLLHYLETNRTVFTTTPTEDTLVEAMTPVFNNTPPGSTDERIVFCGKGALDFINRLVRDATNTTIRFNERITQYGMNLRLLETPHGTFAFKSHPLFTNHSWLNYSMFVLNPPSLTYRPLKGRDTKEKKNIQNPDEDQEKNMWLTEATIEVNFEECMAYIGQVRDQS